MPATTVPRQRAAAAGVVLSAVLLLGPALSGCEYEYSGDHWDDATPSASPPPSTSAALPQDPRTNQPVSGDALDDWVDDVLPEAQGQVFHKGFGTVDAGVTRSETTTQLPGGNYALTLACRSTDRVSFTVRNGEAALVDLSLRCGTSRVSVVHLSADAVLTVEVMGRAAANFAYRVVRL